MLLRACYMLRLACLLAALFLLSMAIIMPTSGRAASNGFRVYLPLLSRAGPSIEQRVIDLTNAQRRQHGCPIPLVHSPQLAAAASAHSQDMALGNLFSHSGSDGSTMVSRIVATGYNYAQLAENLAAGPASPEEVVAGWMTSPEHRANILNCELREIGVGYYEQPDDQSNVRMDNGQLGGPFRYYWTQDFGSR
ncbi:MAG TPA: CAP domain-containing protein [Roseiflexaceae bacterium]|nr:CAP domain-containing protein [Roseiflexaceae bacterium]